MSTRRRDGLSFDGTVILGGKTATGIQVPDDVVTALAAGKRPPVRVTIGGHSFRTTVAPMGGAFWIPLNAGNRDAAGVAAGDVVTVGIEVDTAPRVVEVPERSRCRPRRGQPVPARFFDSLSYSHQRAYVLWIEDAKTGRDPATTGQRRRRHAARRQTRDASLRSPATQAVGRSFAGAHSLARWTTPS